MGNGKELEPGVKGEARAVVDARNTAAAMGSGEIDVFASPAMIALMESAAVAALKGRLPSGETSVGVRLEVSHVAATPLGMQVSAEAVLERIDGRRLFFQVTACDDREKIGEGLHERVLVQREKFMNRVAGKR
ncbi:MAG: thioesterase family protein [Desulfobacteraceae bacterium]|nr:thioesterase family protein [Desulfobacteraceae bacterium]